MMDDGRCIIIDKRYPDGIANDCTLLGGGICLTAGTYNNRDCDFHNDDYMKCMKNGSPTGTKVSNIVLDLKKKTN